MNMTEDSSDVVAPGACVFVVLKVGVNMTSSSPYISYRDPMRVERKITR